MTTGEKVVFTKQYARQDHLILAEPGDTATILGHLGTGKMFWIEMDEPRDDFYARMYVGIEYLEADA